MSELPFGQPGLPSTWASARKQAVGTALSERSRVWFTVADGVLTEVYHPTIDCPNQRDLQFLITDGGELFHEERRDLEHSVEWIEDGIPAFRIVSRDPQGRYRLIKTVCTDPDADCVLERVHHLVWPRDLYHQAMGLLAAGDRERPAQILHYLFSRQREDGSFFQNFWVDGRPYWQGMQLDEVGYPVLLANHLRHEGLLDFDPYPGSAHETEKIVRLSLAGHS